MKEIVLENKKHGMVALTITILLYLAALAACICSGVLEDRIGSVPLFAAGLIWLLIGWIPFWG